MEKLHQRDFLEIERNKLLRRNFVHEIGRDADGATIRVLRDHSGHIIGSQPFDAAIYSRMKYGDPRMIKLAAQELFQKIVSDSKLLNLLRHGEVVFTNESREVPTASYTLMGILVGEYLNPFLSLMGSPSINIVRSERGGEIAGDDYASLSREQRQARIHQRGAFFSEENRRQLLGKKVILFDDLVITGTYEDNQIRLLTESGVKPDDIVPLYWVQIEPEAGQDPVFEKQLNQAAVRNLDDLADIFLIPDVEISERILKFVLPITDQDIIDPTRQAQLADFFRKLYAGNGKAAKAKLGQRTLIKLYTAANSSDGFSKMDSLKDGFSLLEDFLRENDLLKQETIRAAHPPMSFASRYITRTEDLSIHDRKLYSRMKYGDPIATKQAAIQITAEILRHHLIIEKIRSGETVLVTSSAFGVIPTASYAITREVTKLLAASGVKVGRIKFQRRGDFGTNDYGSLTAEERDRKMNSRKMDLSDEDKRKVKGGFILIIDDINVTGSHEKKLHELLCQTEAENWAFVYQYKLDKDLAAARPETEELLNRAQILTVLDLLPFFRTYPASSDMKLRLNSRALKFILSTEPESKYDVDQQTKIGHLMKFFGTIEDEILVQIFRATFSADGYHTDPKFTDGIRVLGEAVLERQNLHRLFKRAFRIKPYSKTDPRTMLQVRGQAV